MKQDRGSFNFVGTFIVILIAVAVWAGIHYAIGYFGNAKAEKVMTETILANRYEASDDIMKEILQSALRQQGPIEVQIDNIWVVRSDDGKRRRARIQYNHPVKIPLTSKVWEIPFSAEVDEKIAN